MNILKSYMKFVGTALSVAAIATLTGCSGVSGSNSEGGKSNSFSSAGQLHDFLVESANKGIMLGHQDDLAYGSTWHGDTERSDMRDVCGDYPAVFGWDISGIESGNSLNSDSITYTGIKEYVKKADNLKGISAIRWDGDSFIDSDNATKNAILDKIAGFFHSLKNNQGNTISVVFQPLSGKIRAIDYGKYKNNWIYLHEYLSRKGIDNILYSFPVAEADDFKSYPGDKYVDIIGFDSLFTDKGDYTPDLEKSVNTITDFAKKHNKVAAISSVGLRGIKEPCFFTSELMPAIKGKGICYAILWKNSWKDEDYCHLPVKGHPAADDFIKFVETKDILTLKDIAQ